MKRLSTLRAVGIYAVAGLTMSVGACSCEDASPVLSRLAAEIEIEPQTLDFGNVPVGAQSQKAVAITNSGSDKLSVCIRIPDMPDMGACTRQARLVRKWR